MLIRAFVLHKKCLISDKISTFPRHPISSYRLRKAKFYTRYICDCAKQQVASHRSVLHCKQFVTPHFCAAWLLISPHKLVRCSKTSWRMFHYISSPPFKIEACFSSPAHISPIEIFNANKPHIEKSQFNFPKIQQKEPQRSISFIFSQGQALQIYIKISTYTGCIWM